MLRHVGQFDCLTTHATYKCPLTCSCCAWWQHIEANDSWQGNRLQAYPAPPVTSMGTPNFFMKRTASACPSRLSAKQPSLSAARLSAPDQAHGICLTHATLRMRCLLLPHRRLPDADMQPGRAPSTREGICTQAPCQCLQMGGLSDAGRRPSPPHQTSGRMRRLPRRQNMLRAPHCSTIAPGWKTSMTRAMMGLNRRWKVASSAPSHIGTLIE